MIFSSLEEFRGALGQGRRLMGMDVGRKRIGLALSDRGWNIATPSRVLERTRLERDLEALGSYVAENDVCAIVCGIPLAANGDDTRMAGIIRSFAGALDSRLNVAILMSDERLTSFMAEEFLMGDMAMGYRRAKKVVDRVAAAYILRDVLDLLGKGI
ncbi:MAG: Holliday junction resolvase RuvX [Rickettsiales bacterium]|nr:Holliday junction resolvase RuvX [Rickettsiales bacterium]